MAKSAAEIAAFEKIIMLMNKTLCETNNYVSPDGNIYHRKGDTYTILTSIDIFLGMFLVPGHCDSVVVASIFADYGLKLKALLMSPFQRLIYNRYPHKFQPDNELLQCLAKTVRKEVKETGSLKIDFC